MLNIEEIKSRLDTLTARKVELNDEAAGIDRSVRDIAMDLHKENEMLRRHSDQLFQQLQYLCNTIQSFDSGEASLRELREAVGPSVGTLESIENETKFFYREEGEKRPLGIGNGAAKTTLTHTLSQAEMTPLNGAHP